MTEKKIWQKQLATLEHLRNLLVVKVKNMNLCNNVFHNFDEGSKRKLV
jgi:hypothetical protein